MHIYIFDSLHAPQFFQPVPELLLPQDDTLQVGPNSYNDDLLSCLMLFSSVETKHFFAVTLS